jgi:hypothetical protein
VFDPFCIANPSLLIRAEKPQEKRERQGQREGGGWEGPVKSFFIITNSWIFEEGPEEFLLALEAL